MTEIEKLYALQEDVLKSLSDFAGKEQFPFNLAGGTALVRFHAKEPYRISYDLDFFSTGLITRFNFDRLTNHLQKEFSITTVDNLIEEGTPFFRINIVGGKGNLPLKVEFVEDLFSGAFEGETLEGYSFKIEPIYAIYTRKIWAIASALEKDRGEWDRIKDLIDLVYLDREYRKFEKFFSTTFRNIARQNGIGLMEGRMISYLHALAEIIMKKYTYFEGVLKKGYESKYSLDEVLKWIQKKKMALRHGQTPDLLR